MKIQDHIASLEFGLELKENERVQDALILMRVTDMETGRTTFAMTKTEGTDSIVCAGLISAGTTIEADGWESLGDEA